jgi:hypothetical protein
VHQPVQERTGQVQVGRPLVGLLGLVGDLHVAHYLGVQAEAHFK